MSGSSPAVEEWAMRMPAPLRLLYFLSDYRIVVAVPADGDRLVDTQQLHQLTGLITHTGQLQVATSGFQALIQKDNGANT